MKCNPIPVFEVHVSSQRFERRWFVWIIGFIHEVLCKLCLFGVGLEEFIARALTRWRSVEVIFVKEMQPHCSLQAITLETDSA